jgi:hypothetical protein
MDDKLARVGKEARPEPVRGDYIRIKRKGGYSHDGIYIGNGEVIHFSDAEGFKTWKAVVRRDRLKDFGDPEEIEVIKSVPGSELPRETTVLVAIKLLGSKGYHLTRNNCEHLATFCKTGRHESIRVEALHLAVKLLHVGAGKLRVTRRLDRYLAKKKTPSAREELVFPKLPTCIVLEGEIARRVDEARELIAREERKLPAEGVDAAIAGAARALEKYRLDENGIAEFLGTDPTRVAKARNAQPKDRADS